LYLAEAALTAAGCTRHYGQGPASESPPVLLHCGCSSAWALPGGRLELRKGECRAVRRETCTSESERRERR